MKPSGFVFSAYQRLISSRPVATAMDRARAIDADDVLDAGREQDLGARDARCAGADDHDRDVLGSLVDDAQRVQERGQHDDGRPVLVVVEDRDVELLAQPALDLEAAGRRDVLEVDAAEAGRDRLDGAHDLVDVLRREADRERVDAAELLEQHRLALHHGHRGLGADVAEAEHGGAVRDDGDGVALDRQRPGALGRLGDREADARDAGRVRHREVVARAHGRLRRHLDLAAEVQQERAVGDALHLDAVERPHGLDDPLAVLRVAGVDGDVAHRALAARAHEVDRAEVAARLADRGRDAREAPGRRRARRRGWSGCTTPRGWTCAGV